MKRGRKEKKTMKRYKRKRNEWKKVIVSGSNPCRRYYFFHLFFFILFFFLLPFVFLPYFSLFSSFFLLFLFLSYLFLSFLSCTVFHSFFFFFFSSLLTQRLRRNTSRWMHVIVNYLKVDFQRKLAHVTSEFFKGRFPL